MQLGSREHQEMIASFEMNMKSLPIRCRFEKEQRSLWSAGNVYQDGATNSMFRVYTAGYANARCVYFQG